MFSEQDRAIYHILITISKGVMEASGQKENLEKTVEMVFNKTLEDKYSTEYEEMAKKLFEYFFGKELVRTK